MVKFNLSLLPFFSSFPLEVETAEEYLEEVRSEEEVEGVEAWRGVEEEVEGFVEEDVEVEALVVVEVESDVWTVVEFRVEVEGAGTSGRGSVWQAVVHISRRACTVDAKETLGEGVACASITRFLASPYEIPSVALTVQISFSTFHEGQSLEEEE